MDAQTLNQWRKTIKQLLTELAEIPYVEGVDLQKKTIFDDQRDNYLVLVLGWEDFRRLHGCIVHLELIDNKIWIHEDGTDYGVATDLVAAGVPKENIVLGFKTPRLRSLTGFAVA